MFRVMRMQWRDVLFASWPMDPRVIAGKLPSGLKPDLHEGKAWMSLVAFENKDMRARGAPRWAGVDLPELNLRTYVTYRDAPGVLFISMDAQGAASVAGGRLFFQLPYYYARIRSRSDGDGHHFASRRMHPRGDEASFEADYREVAQTREAEAGSLEAFLLERYRLYTSTPLGLACLDVAHLPWRVRDAQVKIATNTLFSAAGLPDPQSEPLCHCSPGVEVTASLLRRA